MRRTSPGLETPLGLAVMIIFMMTATQFKSPRLLLFAMHLIVPMSSIGIVVRAARGRRHLTVYRRGPRRAASGALRPHREAPDMAA